VLFYSHLIEKENHKDTKNLCDLCVFVVLILIGGEAAIYQKLKTTFKHMVVFGLGGVVNRALSVLLIPLYTKYIPPREYGALALMMTMLTIIPVVLRVGLGNALFRSWYDYEESERPKLATTVMVFLIALSVPVLAILAYFAPRFSVLLFDTDKYTLHLRIICLLSFLEIFNVVPDTLMRIKNASVQYSLFQTTSCVAQLSMTVALVKYFDWGIQGVLIGNLIGSALENGMVFTSTLRQMGWGFNRAELKLMLAFGFPNIFGRLAASCFQSIDRFFLNHYTSLRVVGLYALGNQLASPITMLVTTPFSMIWVNMQFSSMKDRDATEYFARMLTYVVYVAALLALPLAILVEDVLRIFAPLKYWESATIVPLLAVAAMLDAATTVVNVGISIKRKTFVNPLIVAGSALINILLNFLLTPRFGMMGATVAIVASYLAVFILRYRISNSLLPIHYEWGRIFKIAIVCLVLFTMSRAIVIERPIYSFFARLPFCLLLPLILVPFKFYDQREWTKAGELLRRVKNLLRPVAQEV
jgi:O-antigen/teichoic acid export membrane protein